MGWSKGIAAFDTIVLLEWENGQQTTSPCLQFWTLDCPVDNRTQSLPIPLEVPDRIPEPYPRNTEICGSESQGKVHLPPLLTYDSGSNSILMHNLTVDDNVDVEFIRWGPGIRLTQTQAMESLFHRAPRVLSNGKYSWPSETTCSIFWRGGGSYSANSALLTAITMDNNDGTVTIKYRAKQLGRDSVLLLDIKEAYKSHEQTLRAFNNAPASHATQPSPLSNVPVHMCWLGRGMRYLLLITMTQNEQKAKKVLSLYTIPEELGCLDACTMKKPNEDRGLRWQVQTFELPMQVSNIAPVVVHIAGRSYLLVFYFDKGLLHYARMKYAGSGSLVDFVDKIRCAPDPIETSSSQARDLRTTSRSRFPLLPRLSVLSYESDPDPDAEHSRKERQDESLPLGAEGCQPYAVIANGFLWVFYQGADMNGRYVRRRLPREIEVLNTGWETASWTAETLPKGQNGGREADVSRHFIPVVVPKEFMSMY